MSKIVLQITTEDCENCKGAGCQECDGLGFKGYRKYVAENTSQNESEEGQ